MGSLISITHIAHYFKSKHNANSKTLQVNGYNIVKIQELEPSKNKINVSKVDMEKMWKQKKCNHYYSKCECKILSYSENTPCHIESSNAFYTAFALAYNSHQDLILVPDDVWLVICLQFSKYINANAEALRSKFVSFDGKQKLSVTTSDEISESDWSEFFTLMIEKIRSNTKDNIVDELEAKFTTTDHVTSLISIATVMDSFKAYFDYGRCIPCCGIPNIKFAGSLEDWKSIKSRLHNLRKYALDQSMMFNKDKWYNYISKLEPIIDKFIDTYQGNVDVGFWNKVMNERYGSLGSGLTSYVSGWILNFYGLDGEVDCGDVELSNIDVPVKISNHLTNTQKTVNVIGGFGGVYIETDETNPNKYAFRPQQSMAVFHDGNEESL
jgi:hypothetical protein